MADNFFERNESEVCKLMCRIILWMSLIFPVFFLLSYLNIFKITINQLLTLLPWGLLCSISPTIMLKCHVKTKILKYYSIVAIAFVIMLMASNAHVGVYMTYCLALALSCLYFDKNFTIRTAFIGYFCMVIAVYIRSGNVDLPVGDTRMKWFVAYTMGYTMEYVAMSFVFVAMAGRARKLLNSLHNTEQVKQILEHCGTASISLGELLSKLKGTIKDTINNSSRIEHVTDCTREGCEHNLEQANQTTASIQKMDINISQISEQTACLSEITINSYEKTKGYIQIMDKTVDFIERIKDSGKSIQDRINEVEQCTREIGEFAKTIAGITSKTNMLALNASIEAARAGEEGRAFAVVAGQVSQLAEATKNATIKINESIEQMNESVKNADLSVVQNAETVEAGINEIISARDEAGLLLEFQNQSSNKVKEVEEHLKTSEECQRMVSSMASDMSNVTSQSLNQVSEIHFALEEQTKLTQHMQEAFEQVQGIAEELKNISLQEV